MNKSNLKERVIRELAQNIEAKKQQPTAPAPKQKTKETIVAFDKSTNPFEVKFSERGFEIDGTRLSFELLETALSKDVNIVLDKGSGLVLDAIKMEKIMKYKDLYQKNQQIVSK